MTGSQMPTALDDPLRKFALAFREQAAENGVTLRVLGATAVSTPDPDARDAALSAMRTLAHRLAGRGGTFGFPAISVAAADLEVSIDAALPREALVEPDAAPDASPAEAGAEVSPEALSRIQGLLATLCSEIAALSSAPDP